MKRLLILAALLASLGTVSAAEIEGYSASIDSISTNTTPSTFTNGPIYGKLVSISAVSRANANVRFRTIAGKGATIGDARILVNTNALTSSGYITNIAETVYMYGDYIVTELTSAPSNGVAYSGLILVNPTP